MIGPCSYVTLHCDRMEASSVPLLLGKSNKDLERSWNVSRRWKDVRALLVSTIRFWFQFVSWCCCWSSDTKTPLSISSISNLCCSSLDWSSAMMSLVALFLNTTNLFFVSSYWTFLSNGMVSWKDQRLYKYQSTSKLYYFFYIMFYFTCNLRMR